MLRRYSYARYSYTRLIIPAIALLLGISIVVFQVSYSRQWAGEKLAREGYSNVTLTGWKPFTLWCTGKEGIAQGFTGRDARGAQRSGYVCSNLFYSYIVD